MICNESSPNRDGLSYKPSRKKETDCHPLTFGQLCGLG